MQTYSTIGSRTKTASLVCLAEMHSLLFCQWGKYVNGNRGKYDASFLLVGSALNNVLSMYLGIEERRGQMYKQGGCLALSQGEHHFGVFHGRSAGRNPPTNVSPSPIVVAFG
jgi:hypothetical protein